MKFVIIGGGSSYTPELFDGIIKRIETIPIQEIVLVDVAEGWKKTGIILELGKRMFEKASVSVELTMTQNRRQALEGARFVINQIRVGRLEARILDEKIPLRYGLVGQETTGAGGFAKALRTVPVALEIAEDISRICPEAWLINFANPAGIVTEALHRHADIKSIGLCNVPINMERQIASAIGAEPSELNCEFVGLNHLSWIKEVWQNGRPILKELLKEGIGDGQVVSNIPSMENGGDLTRALGIIPSPYLSYYYDESAMVEEEQTAVEEGKGTRGEQVRAIEEDLFNLYADPCLETKPPQLEQRGGALYSFVALSLVESLLDPQGRAHVVNLVNRGAIPELPYHSVIETNAMVNASGAKPLVAGALPLAIRGLVQQVKAYEELTIEAAVNGSREKALLALLTHPLVHGYENAKNVLEDILAAHRPYLERFFRSDI